LFDAQKYQTKAEMSDREKEIILFRHKLQRFKNYSIGHTRWRETSERDAETGGKLVQ
jgi:hypothetical protein